jgi:hypothetical protein
MGNLVFWQSGGEASPFTYNLEKGVLSEVRSGWSVMEPHDFFEEEQKKSRLYGWE